MAAKLTLDDTATFTAPVEYTVPGGEKARFNVTYKWRTSDELKEFGKQFGQEGGSGLTDAEVFMEIATGWDLKFPFSEEAVTKLTQKYIGIAAIVLAEYFKQHTASLRQGN